MRRPIRAVASAVLLVGALSCDGSGGITKDADPTTTTGATTTTDAPSEATDPQPGSIDVGDPTTPGAGNGGYDVTNYALEIEVLDEGIRGVTTITATATQDLSTFNLDLRKLTLEAIEVEGRPATFVTDEDEVTVTPRRPIALGDEFTARVEYGGVPEPVPDPAAPGNIGWLESTSGSFVAAEPVGAKGIFPCNDHPSDKATFEIEVIADDDEVVAANGVLSEQRPATSGRTRWTFAQTDPMATYLLQIAVGSYEILESIGPHGLTLRDVVVESVTEAERKMLGATAGQIEFFEPMFGPFPLDTYGVLIADAPPNFALETQTLTLLPRLWLQSGEAATHAVMAHELAHQWFGDAVTPRVWGDIWLNEGFATYAEWLWDDHNGGVSLQASVDTAMLAAPQWREAYGPVLDPRPEFLFSPNQYSGAAIFLHALRLTVGDDVFFEILRTWASRFDGKSVTTADFQALASELAGTDLTALFDAWLRSTTVPSMPS